MNRFIAAIALSGLASAAQAESVQFDGHAETHPDGSVEMVILSASPQPTDGGPAQLQELAGQKCTYAGQLARGGRIDSKAHQILSLNESNRYHWSITIDREICPDGVSREVHLVAPLSITAGKDDFKEGTKVLAFPKKANSGLVTERDECLSNLRGLAELNAVKQGFVVIKLHQGGYVSETDGSVSCDAQFQIMKGGKPALSQVYSGQVAKQSQ